MNCPPPVFAKRIPGIKNVPPEGESIISTTEDASVNNFRKIKSFSHGRNVRKAIFIIEMTVLTSQKIVLVDDFFRHLSVQFAKLIPRKSRTIPLLSKTRFWVRVPSPVFPIRAFSLEYAWVIYCDRRSDRSSWRPRSSDLATYHGGYASGPRSCGCQVGRPPPRSRNDVPRIIQAIAARGEGFLAHKEGRGAWGLPAH